ncbi:MAG: DUF3576 domain-containing protein [Alphaproteobacteria bacterium]
MMSRCRFLFFLLPMLAIGPLLNACDAPSGDTENFPQTDKQDRKDRVGKLSGDDGIVLSGSEKKDDAGTNPLGVNSFLWRASLDTIAFMPLASADPFGGVIITEWHEDPNSTGERFKINILILDRQLRADSLKATLFKQKKDEKTGNWRDAPVDPATSRKLEDTILTRARQLRVAQLGY